MWENSYSWIQVTLIFADSHVKSRVRLQKFNTENKDHKRTKNSEKNFLKTRKWTSIMGFGNPKVMNILKKAFSCKSVPN